MTSPRLQVFRGNFILPLLIVSGGCAGKLEPPERVYRATDHEIRCVDIDVEASTLLQRIPGLEADLAANRSGNLGVWLAGQLLILPTLGMDVTGNAEIQRTAIIRRLQRLKELAAEKQCSFESMVDTAPDLIKKT